VRGLLYKWALRLCRPALPCPKTRISDAITDIVGEYATMSGLAIASTRIDCATRLRMKDESLPDQVSIVSRLHEAGG
jgi:hypothetical protein